MAELIPPDAETKPDAEDRPTAPDDVRVPAAGDQLPTADASEDLDHEAETEGGTEP